MKKTLLLIAFSLVCFCTYAQITINKPTINVGMRMQRISQNVIVDANTLKDTTGTNKSWDFSGLVKDGPSSIGDVEIVSVASTPYASMFPEANLASKTIDETGTNYSYIKLTDTEFSIYGSVSSQDTGKFIDPLTLMKFPFNYGNSFNDKFSVLAEGQTFEFDNNVKYVASGSLKTPGGSFSNVALIRRIQEFSPMPNVKVKTEIFSWFDDKFEQLMEISISYPSFPGQQTTYSGSYDVSGPSSVEELTTTFNQANFYPNPSDGQFNLFNTGNLSTLKVTDVLGRTMTEQKLFVGNNTISTSGWTSGVYYGTLTDLQGKTTVQRLIVR
jgi:hypothetical protein